MSGALLYVYVNESTTSLATIYTDETLSIPAANPAEANTSGQFPPVWAESGTEADPVFYRVAVTKSDGESPGNAFVFDNYRPSVDFDVATAALAESSALSAEYYAAIAEAVAGPLIGSGLEFGPYTADGTDTTYLMAQTVQAGNEFTVDVYVAGVPQFPDAYSCDGSNVLTFTEAPEAGAIIEGVHVAQSVGIAMAAPPARTVPGGPLLSTTARFVRDLDLGDAPGISKGVGDDGPSLEAAFAYAPVWSHSAGVVRINSDTAPVGKRLSVTSGQFYIASGKVLNLSGVEFEAPVTANVFTGPGEVRGLVKASPMWFGATGDDITDDGPAFSKAGRAAQTTVAPEGDYAILTPILYEPTLQKPCYLVGGGVSVGSGGTRLHSRGGASCVSFSGTLNGDDPSANAEYGAKDIAIMAGVGAAPIGMRIAGEGGATSKTLRSLTGGQFENVTVNEFNTNVAVYSVFNVVFDGCRFESQTTVGISCDLGVTAGGQVSSEINFIRSKLTQPTSGAGVALKLTVSDATSNAACELRGVTLDDDTQLYAGTGYCIDGLVIGNGALTRTMGDITIAPGCKLQGDGGITSDGAVRFRAQDGGAFSSLHIDGVQVESSEGPAISLQITTTGATFGTIHTITIANNTFRYNEGRSIQLDGVKGFTVTNNKLAFCGQNGSSVTEHIWANNCAAGRIENNIASAKAAGSWPGLATGITIAGTSTNVLTRANALGVTTARTGGTDSADQPSVTVQV